MNPKNIFSAIGVFIVFGFTFLCIEFFMYSILLRNDTAVIIPLVFLLTIAFLSRDILYEMKITSYKWMSEVLIWGSVFAGLGVLKILLPFFGI